MKSNRSRYEHMNLHKLKVHGQQALDSISQSVGHCPIHQKIAGSIPN